MKEGPRGEMERDGEGWGRGEENLTRKDVNQ